MMQGRANSARHLPRIWRQKSISNVSHRSYQGGDLSSPKLQKHRALLETFAKELGLKRMEDWYGFGALQSKRLSFPLDEYDGSIVFALTRCFPEHEWKIWKFAKVPQRWWAEVENQRSFFDEIASQLGVTKLEDWYSISRKQVAEIGGLSPLTDFHGNSLINALKTVYPHHEWLPWRFSASRVPQRYWSDRKNQRAFLDWCFSEMNLKHMDDWYNVPVAKIASLRGGAMLRSQYNFSLFRALVSVYPEHTWDPSRFAQTPYNSTIAEIAANTKKTDQHD